MSPAHLDSPSTVKPAGVVQHQASINLRPQVWQEFKQQAWTRGISAAQMLGELVIREVEAPTEVSVIGDGNTVACQITPAVELISRIRRDVEDLISKRYILSENDRNRLYAILKNGLVQLEGMNNGNLR